MDKPNANADSMSKSKEDISKYHQQEDLSNFGESKFNVLDFPIIKYYQSSDLSTIKTQKKIESAGLIEFLEELGIPLKIARHYFHEVHIYNKQTREKLRTLGFLNDEEGFELINPFFKGTIGTQRISFIAGTNPKPESMHIFKESLDYLAFLSKLGTKKITIDAIILHANKCVEQINPYIKEYGYKKIYTWMENNEAGATTTQYLDELAKKEEGLRHMPRNKLYAPFKNLSKWYQQQVQANQ